MLKEREMDRPERWRSRHALIQQDATDTAHATCESNASVACSRNCTACSRLTPAKSSRKSSSVSPASRQSSNVRTGTRVPTNTGVPERISGWL